MYLGIVVNIVSKICFNFLDRKVYNGTDCIKIKRSYVL